MTDNLQPAFSDEDSSPAHAATEEPADGMGDLTTELEAASPPQPVPADMSGEH